MEMIEILGKDIWSRVAQFRVKREAETKWEDTPVCSNIRYIGHENHDYDVHHAFNGAARELSERCCAPVRWNFLGYDQGHYVTYDGHTLCQHQDHEAAK